MNLLAPPELRRFQTGVIGTDPTKSTTPYLLRRRSHSNSPDTQNTKAASVCLLTRSHPFEKTAVLMTTQQSPRASVCQCRILRSINMASNQAIVSPQTDSRLLAKVDDRSPSSCNTAPGTLLESSFKKSGAITASPMNRRREIARSKRKDQSALCFVGFVYLRLLRQLRCEGRFQDCPGLRSLLRTI